MSQDEPARNPAGGADISGSVGDEGDEGYDYDVIVVGSGFGGAVAALRLSEKGYRVGVLEAGRRFTAQSLPKNSWHVRDFLWAPRLGCTGIQRIHLLKDCVILAGAAAFVDTASFCAWAASYSFKSCVGDNSGGGATAGTAIKAKAATATRRWMNESLMSWSAGVSERAVRHPDPIPR